MKKTPSLLLIISVLAFNAKASTEIHDNNFCTSNAYFVDFKLNNPDSFSITQGQPYTGQQVVESDNMTCIQVKAGRKNDKSNAKWVKDGLDLEGIPWDGAHMVGIDTKSYTPNELNFALEGTLTLILKDVYYICPNVYIGQGSNPENDNWWIFNNNKDEDNSIECYNILTKEKSYLYPRPNHDGENLKGYIIKFETK